MKRYTFQIEVFGFGENEEDACQDAIEALEMDIGELGSPIEIVEVDKDFEPIED